MQWGTFLPKAKSKNGFYLYTHTRVIRSVSIYTYIHIQGRRDGGLGNTHRLVASSQTFESKICSHYPTKTVLHVSTYFYDIFCPLSKSIYFYTLSTTNFGLPISLFPFDSLRSDKLIPSLTRQNSECSRQALWRTRNWYFPVKWKQRKKLNDRVVFET